MHRTLIAGMSALALLAVAGCAQTWSPDTAAAGSGSSLSDDPAFAVQGGADRRSGNAPGAGMPIDRSSASTPGILTGDGGKRTMGETGGN